MDIIALQHFFRMCEEADANSEGSWTWAYPNTPFTQRTCIERTNEIYCSMLYVYLNN